jgi:hypothetical protein
MASNRFSLRFVFSMGLAVAAAGLVADAAPAPKFPAPPYLGAFPDFNPALTTQLPGDVDVALKKSLEAQKKFANVQREFDLWSWQAFLTLNWPVNNQGKFSPKIGDTSFGPPDWTTWTESTDIYRADGATPRECAKTGPAMLSLSRDASLPVARDLKAFQVPANFDKRRVRLLGDVSAVGDRSPNTPARAKTNNLNDILQAFTGPLIDQNGNFVFYEIMLDPNEVSYVCGNKLYNINGQVVFSKGGKVSANLPKGQDGKNGSGAWELKLAWRVLTKNDDVSRYLNTPAIVPAVNGKCPDHTAAPNGQCNVTVGLVGMHIGHKSDTSPQWIWSTFEQVDNLSVNNVANPNISASFANANCPICVPDQLPDQNGSTWANAPPTQAMRAIPIPADKVALNDQATAGLMKQNTALRFYQLIDTQWPTSPTTKPTPWNAGLPGAVENKPGGKPTPVFLTNITMETYFQHGVQAACNAEELPSNAICPGTFQSKTPGAPAQGDTTPIFATESCMGCHSSAGLYTSLSGNQSGQLTGDFSWLFTQKAQLAKR